MRSGRHSAFESLLRKPPPNHAERWVAHARTSDSVRETRQAHSRWISDFGRDTRTRDRGCQASVRVFDVRSAAQPFRWSIRGSPELV